MTPLFGISYRRLDYLQKSISSILDSNPKISCYIVDSLSPHSDQIREWGRKQSNLTWIESSTNCKGHGLIWSYQTFPKSDWFIFTDLDIVVPKNTDWFSELSKAMETSTIAGFSLDTSNYVPPNGGFSEDGFGCWLMGIKSAFFDFYLSTKLTSGFTDGDLLWTAMQNGATITKLPTKLYHLGWDLWKDDPEYFKEKQQGINWQLYDGSSYKVFH